MTCCRSPSTKPSQPPVTMYGHGQDTTHQDGEETTEWRSMSNAQVHPIIGLVYVHAETASGGISLSCPLLSGSAFQLKDLHERAQDV